VIETYCSVIDFGLIDYKKAYKAQLEFLMSRQLNEISDVLILLEHPHVYTIGRLGSKSNLLINQRELKKREIFVYEVDRGGDITYHGPGQLVAYPIMNLKLLNLRIIDYLRKLEESVIRFFEDFGVNSTRKEGLTGVWVRDKKIASIGIGVKKWVTYHGISININSDLDYFNLINPCGIRKLRMTSLASVLDTRIDMHSAKRTFIESFMEVFGFRCDGKIPALD
jgi:lipoate-protein ligase B